MRGVPAAAIMGSTPRLDTSLLLGAAESSTRGSATVPRSVMSADSTDNEAGLPSLRKGPETADRVVCELAELGLEAACLTFAPGGDCLLCHSPSSHSSPDLSLNCRATVPVGIDISSSLTIRPSLSSSCWCKISRKLTCSCCQSGLPRAIDRHAAAYATLVVASKRQRAQNQPPPAQNSGTAHLCFRMSSRQEMTSLRRIAIISKPQKITTRTGILSVSKRWF